MARNLPFDFSGDMTPDKVEQLNVALKTIFEELGFTESAFEAHASRHEDGGDDEISVEGLSGLLADPQTPIAHNLLSARHGDTTVGTVVRGDLATGQGATPTWTRLAKGAANTVLKSDGTDLSYSLILNAMVDAAAGIVYSKLNLTGSIVNADISAAAAIVYSKLNLAASIVNADIAVAAAIAYSKLNLSGSIVNADVNAAAAIVYSKLNLTGGIVNADINASAAIAASKLAAPGSTTQVMFNDGGVPGADAGMTYNKTTDALTLAGALIATGPVSSEGASAYGNVTPIAAGSIALTLKKTLSTVGSASTMRLFGYSPSIEFLDKDSVANWFAGLDDNDSDKFVIGRGYGPNQGITPAIKINGSDVVELSSDLTLATAASVIRRTTSDASDTGSLEVNGGGGSGNTRGGAVKAFGNEHATLPGAIHLYSGATGHIRFFGQSAQQIGAMNGSTGSWNLDGGALLFPSGQIASTDANGLDDYEEGTWTPVIGGGGGTSGQTYLIQTGNYVKVGKLVFASFACQLSVKGTITGIVQIQGFPFSIAAGQGVFCSFHSLATSVVSINGTPSGTIMDMRQMTAIGTSSLGSDMATADINNDSQIRGWMCYVATT